jgi:hypothetical protein
MMWYIFSDDTSNSITIHAKKTNPLLLKRCEVVLINPRHLEVFLAETHS